MLALLRCLGARSRAWKMSPEAEGEADAAGERVDVLREE
jgi:hypothetical protein